MHKPTRIAAAAAVSTLVAATTFAGAGVANAQQTVTFSSPSTLSMERGDDNLIYVSYDNRSERDLECLLVVSNNNVISGLDRHVRSSSDPLWAFADPQNWPAGLQVAADAAIDAHEFNIGETSAPAGYNGILEITGGTDLPMNTTFSVHGMSLCLDESDPSAVYVEFERTTGGGMFGSIENLFGSAS